jgi:hypothetical protein
VAGAAAAISGKLAGRWPCGVQPAAGADRGAGRLGDVRVADRRGLRGAGRAAGVVQHFRAMVDEIPKMRYTRLACAAPGGSVADIGRSAGARNQRTRRTSRNQ